MDSASIDINNYILLNKIGNNSFSELCTIKEKNTGEVLAAKISLNSYDDSNPLNSKLIKDIIKNKQHGHAAILQYIGYSAIDFHNENKLVIFSQYMPNQSLDLLINQSPISSSWNETKKLICIYGISSAMSFLHSHDIIHGSLYPTNILMDYNMFPKISDFHLFNLHFTNQNTIDTQRSIYIAPELCGKTDRTKAGDVYAFGMLIYEIITNERPFKDSTFLEILTKVSNGNRPEIPPMNEPYKNLIEFCWSQNSEDRPTFIEIQNLLRNDESFITASIDRKEYENYVKFIDEYQRAYERSQTSISYEDFISGNSKSSTTLSNDQQGTPENKGQLEMPQVDSAKNKIDDIQASNDILSPPTQNMPAYVPELASKNLLNEPAKANDFLGTINSRIQNIPDNILNQNSSLYIPPYQDTGIPQSPYSMMQNIHPSSAYFGASNEMIEQESKNSNDSEQATTPVNSTTLHKKHISFIPVSPLKYLNKYSAFREEPKVDRDLAHFLYLFPNESKRKEAIYYLKNSIKKGSTKAMNTYGEMLYKGEGVEMDKEEAAKYFKMSFENGDLDGMYNYACVLFNGEGIKSNVEESVRYFQTLTFEHKHIYGMSKYGTLMFKGIGVPIDQGKAISLIKRSADLGCPDAMINYGYFLSHGTIVQKNKKEAFRYYKMAADHGLISAFYICGCYLINGTGVPVNEKEGTQYLKVAADNGIADAMFIYAITRAKTINFGNCMFDHQYVYSTINECLRYFKMAADNGNVDGMLTYGNFLIEGKFLPASVRDAAWYYKLAADKGSDAEMVFYAQFLLSGKLGVVNKKEVAKYYKKAADKGNVLAMKEYATMLRNGDGIQTDKKEAGKYYRIAAQRGDIVSMNMFGLMSLNGEIESDKREAFEFLTDAANAGFGKAIYNLGMAIYRGYGTAPNKDVAIELFKRASRKGVKEATDSLTSLGIQDEKGCSIY